MNHGQKHLAAGLLALAALLSMGPIQGAWAQTAPNLGAAAGFALLSGADPSGGAGDKSLTLTRSTVVGNVGSNGTAQAAGSASVTLTNSTVNGTVFHTGSLVSTSSTMTSAIAGVPPAVITAFYDAYDALKLVGCDQMRIDTLASVTLTPGVYCFDAAAAPTGVLTLDGEGVYIFKIGTGLVGGALSPTDFSVNPINGASACNVTWWVADAATIVRGDFKGNILAGRAITATGTTVTAGTPPIDTLEGRAFSGRDSAVAADKSVTMTDMAVTGCGGTPPPSCDRDHRHHKHCGHHGNDKPHCDGDHDGHHGHHKGHGNGHGWDDDDNGRGNGHGSDHDSPFKR